MDLTQQNVYKTYHLGLASTLRFCLGPACHLSTEVEEGSRRMAFIFADPENLCEKLAEVFFSEAGMATDDARALIDASRDLKKTMTAAIHAENGEQVWRNPALNPALNQATEATEAE